MAQKNSKEKKEARGATRHRKILGVESRIHNEHTYRSQQDIVAEEVTMFTTREGALKPMTRPSRGKEIFAAFTSKTDV